MGKKFMTCNMKRLILVGLMIMLSIINWQCNKNKYKTNQLIGDWVLSRTYGKNAINKSKNLLKNEMPESAFGKTGSSIVFLKSSKE